MRKWKLEHNDYWQNYNLYEDAPLGKQLLTHITDSELERIKQLVDHHNTQVEETEKNTRVEEAIKALEGVMEELFPHLKDREKLRKGSTNDAIYRAYWSISSVIREIQ
jgi:hypothetical protein